MMPDARASAFTALEQAVREAEAPELPGLLGELERISALAWARLAVPKADSAGREDQLLSICQAAERLGVPEGWLKKRPDLPFRVVLARGTVRYSADGIAAYIRGRCRTTG